jgi:hypothetical protein
MRGSELKYATDQPEELNAAKIKKNKPVPDEGFFGAGNE